MPHPKTAKLFRNGASQAVRLPAEFRFEGDEVFVHRDPRTGDVTLSTRPGAQTWANFYEMLDHLVVPDDFLADRPMNTPPMERDIFGI